MTEQGSRPFPYSSKKRAYWQFRSRNSTGTRGGGKKKENQLLGGEQQGTWDKDKTVDEEGGVRPPDFKPSMR